MSSIVNQVMLAISGSLAASILAKATLICRSASRRQRRRSSATRRSAITVPTPQTTGGCAV